MMDRVLSFGVFHSPYTFDFGFLALILISRYFTLVGLEFDDREDRAPAGIGRDWQGLVGIEWD
jgi:hypothetical protein